MNVDCECAKCRRRLYAGMYVFEVGPLRYCQGCVKKVLLLESDRPGIVRASRPLPIGANWT